jgi:hypothetical protein
VVDDSGNSRELSIDEVAPVLQIAVQEPPGLTLIGGQALNFWADRYLESSPVLQALLAERAFVSGDLDFVGALAAPRPGAARAEIDVAGELAVARKMSRILHGHLETKGEYNARSVTLAEMNTSMNTARSDSSTSWATWWA